jgi:general stress protein CsbA
MHVLIDITASPVVGVLLAASIQVRYASLLAASIQVRIQVQYSGTLASPVVGVLLAASIQVRYAKSAFIAP